MYLYALSRLLIYLLATHLHDVVVVGVVGMAHDAKHVILAHWLHNFYDFDSFDGFYGFDIFDDFKKFFLFF